MYIRYLFDFNRDTNILSDYLGTMRHEVQNDIYRKHIDHKYVFCHSRLEGRV